MEFILFYRLKKMSFKTLHYEIHALPFFCAFLFNFALLI